MKRLLNKLWRYVSYKTFMAGVEQGKYEITSCTFIVTEPMSVGDGCTWSKGGYLKKNENSN